MTLDLQEIRQEYDSLVGYDDAVKFFQTQVPKLFTEIERLKAVEKEFTTLVHVMYDADNTIMRLRGLFETLQRVTGQATHFPIEYESFVQRVTRQALEGGKS